EAGHARLGPVEGHAADDRVTWATIGAGGEGVAPAPVVRVEDLMTTPFTPGPVRRYAYRPLLTLRSLAGENAERRVSRWRRLHARHPGHDGRRGGLPRQQLAEPLQPVPRPLDMDQHAGGVIPHPPRQLRLPRQAVDEGAKADALHHAA